MLLEKYPKNVKGKSTIFRKDEALPLPHIINLYKKECILCQLVCWQCEAQNNYAHYSKNLVLVMPRLQQYSLPTSSSLDPQGDLPHLWPRRQSSSMAWVSMRVMGLAQYTVGADTW